LGKHLVKKAMVVAKSYPRQNAALVAVEVTFEELHTMLAGTHGKGLVTRFFQPISTPQA
jgi:hypothetical protein